MDGFLVRVVFLAPRANFSLCPHMMERERALVSSSFYKDIPPLWPHLYLITSQWPCLLIPSNWGLGLQHTNFGGQHVHFRETKHSVHINVLMNISNGRKFVLITIILFNWVWVLYVEFYVHYLILSSQKHQEVHNISHLQLRTLGLRELNNLPKVTQLVSSIAQIWSDDSKAQALMIMPTVLSSKGRSKFGKWVVNSWISSSSYITYITNETSLGISLA